MEKVLGYIESGKAEGARLVCGGTRYTEGMRKGYYVRPTIFDNCTRDMRIVREEIFGPVVTVRPLRRKMKPLRWPTIRLTGWPEESSRKASARRCMSYARYGPASPGSIVTADLQRAPWGGYKMSGIGRDLGIQGLYEYQEESRSTLIFLKARQDGIYTEQGRRRTKATKPQEPRSMQ